MKSGEGENVVNLLTSVKAKPRFFLRAILCIAVPFGVSCALDLLLMAAKRGGSAGFGVTFLEWAYSSFYALTVAAGYTLIVAAIYTKGQKSAAKIMLFYALCRFTGEMLEHLRENWSATGEAVSDYDRIMSGVAHLSEFFAAVALAFGVWIMSSAFLRLYKTRDGKRKYALRSGVNFAILFEFTVAFARLIVRSGAGLFGSGLGLSVNAISTFVYEAVEAVVAYAIIAFIGSRIVLYVCTEREF